MGRLHRKKTEAEKREKRKRMQDEKEQQPDSAKAYVPAVKSKGKPKESLSEKENFVGKAVKYLEEAKGELQKVVWPSKNQVVASTAVVIVLVFILSGFLGLVDFLLSGLLSLILQS